MSRVGSTLSVLATRYGRVHQVRNACNLSHALSQKNLALCPLRRAISPKSYRPPQFQYHAR